MRKLILGVLFLSAGCETFASRECDRREYARVTSASRLKDGGLPACQAVCAPLGEGLRACEAERDDNDEAGADSRRASEPVHYYCEFSDGYGACSRR
jgi:hypothetical protein